MFNCMPPRHGNGVETGHFMSSVPSSAESGNTPFFTSAPASQQKCGQSVKRDEGCGALNQASEREPNAPPPPSGGLAAATVAAVAPPAPFEHWSSWLHVGSLVEVEQLEEGLQESRFSARLLRINADRAFVEFAAFSEDDGEGPLCTWVMLAQLWPPPPPAPPNFFDKVGELNYEDHAVHLELEYEGGWWAVILRGRRHRACGALELLVQSERYQKQRWFGIERLRPRWRFLGTAWLAEGYGVIEYSSARLQGSACYGVPPSVVARAPTPVEAQASEPAWCAACNAQGSHKRHVFRRAKGMRLGAPSPPPQAPCQQLSSQQRMHSPRAVDAAVSLGAPPTEGASPPNCSLLPSAEGSDADTHEGVRELQSCSEAELRRRLASVRAALEAELPRVEAAHATALRCRATAQHVANAALQLHPLARSAVLVAGGELELPRCLRGDLPLVHELPV